MKIIIIGPLPPYRGGIAHSNYVLCNNLSKNNELTAINFSRLYPKFLYPGKFQKIETKQKTNFKVLYQLDSINPLSWINVFMTIKKEKPERVFFQWWHPFFAPAYFTISVLTKFFTNTKTGMVIHCALPHEGGFIHNFLSTIMFRVIDFFNAVSKSNMKDVLRLKRSADVKPIYESTYSDYFGQKVIRNDIKNRVLFFGFVRKYKGLHYLLDAMPQVLKKKPELKLDIVGEFWQDKSDYLEKIRRLGIGKSVKIVDRYVNDEEVAKFFADSDAVILPYVSSTQSGIIQLAIGFMTPVISTDVGGNKDIIKSGINGLLVKPRDSEALAKAIVEFYEKKLNKKFEKEMINKLEELKWTKKKEKLFLRK